MSEELNDTDAPNEKDQNNKEEKKFQASLKKLVAVVGDPKKLKLPKAIPNDSVSGVVKELFADEEKELLVVVKGELRDTLKKYAEMEREFKQKEDELAKLKVAKKKEFRVKVEGLFSKIENIGELEKSYYNGLTTALEPTKEG
jgi:hypothetical protein